MTNVYHSNLLDTKFIGQLKSELEKDFKDCKRIAVKIHFGEVGNTKAFTSKDVGLIMKLLEEMKLDYFMYDSSVTYGGPRANPTTHKLLAKAKGFKNVETGDEYVDVKGMHMNYQVCKKLADADAVLVISHVKGHVCTGFGGAIKNLGMGALTAKSKQDIHDGGKPVFNGKCVHCGICVKNCPINGMHLPLIKGVVLKDDVKYPEVKRCFGCSNCAYLCPNDIITTRVAPFDVLLADGANAAQSKFKKYYYVSMVNKVAKQCDCMPMPGEIIAKDAGWLMSPDGVAIDQASHDLVVKNDGEAFLRYNKKKGTEQIVAAERLGMGKRKYYLREL
jgi:hypothetical protein